MAIAVYTPNATTYLGPPEDADRWRKIVLDIAAVGGLLLTRDTDAANQTPLENLARRLTANEAIRSLTGNLDPNSAAEIGKVLDEDSQSAIKAAAALPPAGPQ